MISDEEREARRQISLANLKTDAGPGRPPGQKNFATLYREALLKLASVNGKEPDELELEILSKGITSARSGDYRFYKDLIDRLHGPAVQKVDVTTAGKELNAAANEEIKALTEKLNALHRGDGISSDGGASSVVGPQV